MHRSDPALIKACLSGRQDAWDELVERYGRLVYSVPRRYGLSESDCEDVFQNVFLILHRSLESLRDQTRLSAWLITTAHRESWRIGRRTDDYPDLDRIIEDVSQPSEDHLLAWERQHAVHEGLKQLGGSCEQLLRALFMDPTNPSYEDIGERLGIRVGSIGPTRARCFEKLARILAKLGFDSTSES